MYKLQEQLIELLKVKTIITLIAMSIFAYLSLVGRIPVDKVMEVILIIITYYFAKKASENK